MKLFSQFADSAVEQIAPQLRLTDWTERRNLRRRKSIRAGMKILANRITQELKKRHECGVYEEELARLWPVSDKDREEKIRKFATEYGFRLRYYQPGLCAIFDKQARI